jgi:hypothetical protein
MNATIRMDELHSSGASRKPATCVLDVRSRPEYARGHAQIPWQFNGKEPINPLAWTVTAEIVHRSAERLITPQEARRP